MQLTPGPHFTQFLGRDYPYKAQQYAADGRRTPFPWLLRRHSKVAAVLSVCILGVDMEVKGFGPRHSEERHESDIFSITESKEGLTVLIDTVNERGERADLKVHFEWVRGFRYLDEGDLL